MNPTVNITHDSSKRDRSITQVYSLLLLFCVVFPIANATLQAQLLFPTELIYDNSAGESDVRLSVTREVGDEVIFGGTFRNLIIFQVEYFGEFTPDGDETAIVRFYRNDLETERGPGFNKPGTVLFESEAFPIFPGLNTITLTDIDLEVPDRLTWTVEFGGVSGLPGDRTSLIFRNPPSVGRSFDDIWRKLSSGFWLSARFNADPVANFAARFTSSVDLSVTITDAQLLENGGTQFIVQGPPSQRVLVEMSHDLETWTPIFLGRLPQRRIALTDVRPGVPFPRFIRASLTQDKEISLSGPRFRDDGRVELDIAGPTGLRFILQSSDDLEEWSDVQEFTFGTRAITIVDSNPPEDSSRVYRVILVSRSDKASE